jgi:hypothetical protein
MWDTHKKSDPGESLFAQNAVGFLNELLPSDIPGSFV